MQAVSVVECVCKGYSEMVVQFQIVGKLEVHLTLGYHRSELGKHRPYFSVEIQGNDMNCARVPKFSDGLK